MMRKKSKPKVVDGNTIFHVELPGWKKQDEEYYSLSLDEIRVILDTDNKVIQNRWRWLRYTIDWEFIQSKKPFTVIKKGQIIGKCKVMVEWKGERNTYKLRDTISVKSPIEGEILTVRNYPNNYKDESITVLMSTKLSDEIKKNKDSVSCHLSNNKEGLNFRFNKILVFEGSNGVKEVNRLRNINISVISNQFFIEVKVGKERYQKHEKLKYYTKYGVSVLNLKYKKKDRSNRFALELFFPTTMNQVSEFLEFSREIYLVSDSDPEPIQLDRDVKVFKRMYSYLKQEVYPLVEDDEEMSEDTEESSCYVYLMKDTSNGYYKIGISKDPVYRERTLQSEKPTIELVKKKLFTSRKNSKEVEKLLHEKFLSDNVRGEWFSLDKQDVTLITELLS